MEKTLTPPEQLDFILSKLSFDPLRPWATSITMAAAFTSEGYSYSPLDVDPMMLKLKTDGFVSDDPILRRGLIYDGIRLEDVTETVWFITWDGKFLLSYEGGYKGRMAYDEADRDRIRKVELVQTQLSSMTARASEYTWMVGLVVFLFQYVNFLYENYPNFQALFDRIMP